MVEKLRGKGKGVYLRKVGVECSWRSDEVKETNQIFVFTFVYVLGSLLVEASVEYWMVLVFVINSNLNGFFPRWNRGLPSFTFSHCKSHSFLYPIFLSPPPSDVSTPSERVKDTKSISSLVLLMVKLGDREVRVGEWVEGGIKR